MIDFGRDDPRNLSPHFFYGAIRIDYTSAIRADVDNQKCGASPRYWYVDAVFSCIRCRAEFPFTAQEQRAWYEDYQCWVDSLPQH